MGLGKTVKHWPPLSPAPPLARHPKKRLVVAPASVKYQWKKEIEKFTKLDAQVIEGLVPQRLQLYTSPKFFNLTSYELVLKDIKYLHELQPDLIILDEAQRIRNWATATARIIKQLKAAMLLCLRERRWRTTGSNSFRWSSSWMAADWGQHFASCRNIGWKMNTASSWGIGAWIKTTGSWSPSFFAARGRRS